MLAYLVHVAELSGSFAEPWENVPHIWETYDNEGDILRDLHAQWQTALAGAVFVAIQKGRGDLSSDVGAAYAETLARLGTVRRILDLYADHSAIAAAVSKERALLAAASHALTAA